MKSKGEIYKAAEATIKRCVGFQTDKERRKRVGQSWNDLAVIHGAYMRMMPLPELRYLRRETDDAWLEASWDDSMSVLGDVETVMTMEMEERKRLVRAHLLNLMEESDVAMRPKYAMGLRSRRKNTGTGYVSQSLATA